MFGSLVGGIPSGVRRLVADRAYDSYTHRDTLASRSIEAVIPPRKSNTKPVIFDPVLYKARHAVENAFADLKRFRGIAMRTCKLGNCFIELACLVAWYVSTTEGHRKPSPHLTTDSTGTPTLGDRPRQGRFWQRE